VPVRPQLRAILQRDFFEEGGPTSGLLFRSNRLARKRKAKPGGMIERIHERLGAVRHRAEVG
jgi:hypothetical protein